MAPSTPIDQYIRTGIVRGRYYVIFKNGAVQRWCARNVGSHQDYTTLTSTVWRKAGLDGGPQNANHDGMAGSTYYFDEENDALEAGATFIARLKHKGVI